MVAQSLTPSLLDDPAWFPQQVSSHGIVMVHATRERLRAASFLDGREPFGDALRTVDRASFAQAATQWPTRPLSTLLHVSFCGSTLLSRMLDVPGRTIVYREPAVQIALADKASNGTLQAQSLMQVTAAFARTVDGATPIVKPTSWANVLLPSWTANRAINPVFVVMEPRMFLRAVFRGGRDRIGFTIRLAQHLAPLVDDAASWLAAAGHGGDPVLDVAARLTLVALAAQCTLMRQARAMLGLDERVIVDAAAVFAAPRDTAARVAALFGIGQIADDAADRHAKSPNKAFSTNDEASANRATEFHHAARFDSALHWAERMTLRFDV